MAESCPRSYVQTERSKVCTHDQGHDSHPSPQNPNETFERRLKVHRSNSVDFV